MPMLPHHNVVPQSGNQPTDSSVVQTVLLVPPHTSTMLSLLSQKKQQPRLLVLHLLPRSPLACFLAVAHRSTQAPNPMRTSFPQSTRSMPRPRAKRPRLPLPVTGVSPLTTFQHICVQAEALRALRTHRTRLSLA